MNRETKSVDPKKSQREDICPWKEAWMHRFSYAWMILGATALMSIALYLSGTITNDAILLYGVGIPMLAIVVPLIACFVLVLGVVLDKLSGQRQPCPVPVQTQDEA